MEYHEITNLLGTTPDEVPRFITKKWIEVHDQSGNAEDRYKPSTQIRFKTSMLRSDLCDYQALIQDFVREVGWLAQKIFSAMRTSKILGCSSSGVWGHAPP